MRSAPKSFYNSKQWKDVEKLYKQKRNYLCEKCMEEGRFTPGEIVHHKIHLSESNYRDPEISLNFENLQLLCIACHNSVHYKKSAPKKGKEILQPDQVKQLLNCFEDEWYINLWRWLVCTGLRPGEGLALRWSDIEGDRVTIRQSMNYRGRMTEGKNRNAQRTFYLNSVLLDILRDQKDRTWRLNSDYIFCNHAGQCAKQTDTIHSWYRISREMGSNTSPYSLRHTFVSLMAQTLPEASLKEWVGHSASMDTYGVYKHAVNGEGRKTSDSVGISLIHIKESGN